MPLVPREKIDDVRDRTNIVDVVKRYVELKRAGTGSWKGLCPFHAEKTPSFHVHEARQFFHCFGCGEKGDVFGFVVKIEQRSFAEVLRDLAQQAAVELPERAPLTPAERRARVDAESERDRLLRVMDLATGFFEQCYDSPAGEKARAYVAGRGIGPEVKARFRLGYAPARWDGLQAFLAGKGVDPADGERLGLVGVGERGRYDFFRDRVMLPVFDRQGRVVGFGSRLLDPEAKDRKYVNSPDSPLFHKKECLYGLHAALDAVRKTGRAVVVEGNFDVLALHQAGIEEAVAPMGTALTGDQVRQLVRMAHKVLVVFDGDSAGRRASTKAIPVFAAEWPEEFVVEGGKLVRLPQGMDPDDFIRKEGKVAFGRLLENARPLIDHLIHQAAEEPSVPGRMAALGQVADILVRLKSTSARDIYARQVSGVLDLTWDEVKRALREAVERARKMGPGAARTAEEPGLAGAPRPDVPVIVERALPRDELEFLALVVTYPELLAGPDAKRAGELLIDPAARTYYTVARDMYAEVGQLEVPLWLDSGPPDVRRGLTAALMDEGLSRSQNPGASLRALTARLELGRVDAEISMIQRLHRQASERGDEQTSRAMMLRSIELDKTKQGLRAALQRP